MRFVHLRNHSTSHHLKNLSNVLHRQEEEVIMLIVKRLIKFKKVGLLPPYAVRG